jgi:hypothetical protein
MEGAGRAAMIYVLAFIIAPFKFILSLFKSRIGVLLVIVIVVVFIVIPSVSKPKTDTERPYNQNLPTAKAAPTLVETSSRAYYVQKYTDDGKVIILEVFYLYDQNQWVKSKTPLPIDRSVYGTVRVTKRN